MMVCCVISLDSAYRCDSNEYTQYTIFNIKKKITLNYPQSAAMGFSLETQKRVRNSRGKRSISVRATEGLLFYGCAHGLMEESDHTESSQLPLL